MRFTLQTLLLSVVVIWSAMAAFGLRGLILAGIILGAAAYIRTSESMLRAAAVVCFALLLGLCLLSPLLPAISVAREGSRRAACLNNLKQIGLGLQNYYSAHGHFPPAYVADADGKPMHSWRVLILPYMEWESLYDVYDLDEPWDGPNNSKLAGSMPDEYCCPGSENSQYELGMTNYVAVLGPRTVWPKGETVKMDDIPNGTSNTIMLVEIADSDFHWMEPRDLSFEDAVRRINPKSGRGISSPHVRNNGYFFHDTPIVNVAFADGSVRSLPAGMSPKTLEALLTVDGGETIDTDDFVERRLNWSRCVAVVVLVVSTILLLVRPRGKAGEM